MHFVLFFVIITLYMIFQFKTLRKKNKNKFEIISLETKKYSVSSYKTRDKTTKTVASLSLETI